MTRPGYNRRPSLPCADSVALMLCEASKIRPGLSQSVSTGAGLEAAATHLTTLRAARLGHYPTAADMDAVNDRDGEWGWAHVNNADPLPFKVVV